MERKAGFIWLLFNENGGIIREDGSPINFTVSASDIAGFKPEEWQSYDMARCTFVADGNHATLVEAERNDQWLTALAMQK